MIRDVSLIDYLPLFVQDYREIRQIMNAENPEFQLVADESEKLKNNQFIETTNLDGIARFEKLLKIIPSSDDTLESRISRVLTRWNDVIPYTYKSFIQKLMVLCGGLNFTMNNDFNEYKFEIITHLELSGQVDELQNLLGYIVPSNIEIISNNEIYCDSSTNLSFAVGMAFCEIVDLSDAYKADFSIQGNANVGGSYIGTAEVILSDNYNETVTINGVNKTGSNASVVEITGIK